MKLSAIKAIPLAAAPTHNDISHCARELWTQSGHPTGRDEAIWIEAESRLNAACRAFAAPTVTQRSPATVTVSVTAKEKPDTVAPRASGRVPSKPASDHPLPAGLSGAQLPAFRTILPHPVSHNPHWRDVPALFRRLGRLDEQRMAASS